MLPHRYPFRLVEELPGGRVAVSITADATMMRGAGPLSLALAVEILAQASHVLLSAGSDGVFLAGIEDASLTREMRPGDRLAARAEVEGAFGPLTKVRATLEDGDAVVAEARLLLASR